MKSTTFSALHGLSILIILFSIVNPLAAQVKIKERVEIEPVLPKTHNVSSSNSQSPIGCADLSFSAGVDYVRLIIGDQIVYGSKGAVYATMCSIGEVQFQISYFEIPEDQGVVEVPYHFTASYNGVVFKDIQGYIEAFSAGGFWGGYAWIDYSPPTVIITSPSEGETVFVSERIKPVIRFSEEHLPPSEVSNEPAITWDPSNVIDTKDYYDQFQETMSITVTVTAKNILGEATDQRTILLKKVEDIDHFDVTITPDTIFSNDRAQLSAVAIDKYGNEAELDGNTLINISASPDENIYYSNEVTYSDLQGGDVTLYLDEISTPIQDYIFTVSGNGASGTGKLVVTQPPCLILSAGGQISPGGRAAISIMQKTWDGKVIPYPEDQMFDIWINSGEDYGTLHSVSTGDDGSYLYDKGPFEFVAATDIALDSVVVEIKAWASSGIIVGSVNRNNIDTLRLSEPLMANKQTKAGNISEQQTDLKRKKLELSIKSLQPQLNKESVNKNSEKQKQKLDRMLEMYNARLAYETAKDSTERKNSLAKMIGIASVNAEGGVCKNTAEVTIKKIEKFCPGNYTNVRYDNAVIKTNDKKDSVDAQGNKVYYSVASKGCALTCMAMIAKAGGADINPGKLADYMREKNKFDGPKVYWNATNDLFGNSGYDYDSRNGNGLQYKADGITVDLEKSKPLSLSAMDQDLTQGNLIIAQVYNPTTHANHWVLVTGKNDNGYSINDPGCYQDRNNLSAYGSVYRYIVYKKL